jgi:hypothetical protein
VVLVDPISLSLMVLLTIEGMECAVAPQEQVDIGAGLTTIWQPKAFPSTGFTLPSAEALSTPSYICQVFETLISNARAAGRHVVRVLDLDISSLIGKAVGDSLVSIPSSQVIVDYFLAGVSPEDADDKARAMSYSRARPFVLDSRHINSGASPEDTDTKARATFHAKPFNLDPTQTHPGEYAMAFSR